MTMLDFNLYSKLSTYLRNITVSNIAFCLKQ